MNEYICVIILCITCVSSNFAQNGTWDIYTPDNSPISDCYILSIAFDNQQAAWLGTKYGGLVKFDGETWLTFTPDSTRLRQFEKNVVLEKSVLGPQVNALYSLKIDNHNTKWIGTKIGGLIKFDDHQWTFYNTKNSAITNDRIWSLDIDDNGQKWLGTNGGGVIVFDGSSWINYQQTNSQLPDDLVYAVKTVSTGTKWIGTFSGLVKIENEQWQIYNDQNSPLPVNKIFAFEIDSRGNKWIGTRGGGVVKFNDAGWHIFNTQNSPLPENDIFAIAIDSSGNQWFGTLNSGIVKFVNESWTCFNTTNSPLLNNAIRTIAVDHKNTVWVGTDYGLACYHQSPFSDIHSDKRKTNVPTTLKLKHAYPNPFNSTTSIRFQLKQHEHIKIFVVNINGQPVKTLAEQNFSQGEHECIWDGTDNAGKKLASGIYFVYFHADSFAPNLVQKLMLLK